MSKKMNEQDTDKKLGHLYKDASNETTSSELDASIMAMAQEEVEAQGAADKSWWQRLRMPVSIAASLLVTVGIARFMVELGYYSPDSIANSENQVEMMTYSEEVTIESEPMKPETPVKPKSSSQAAEAKGSVEAAQVSAARLAVEEERVRLQRQQQERQVAEAEMRMMQKKSMEQQQMEADAALLQPKSEVSAETDAPQDVLADNAAESIVVTGARMKRSEVEAEVKDDVNQIDSSMEVSEAGAQVSAPAPILSAEEWLEEIKTALEEEEFEAAKSKWTDFKQAYPDFPVDKSLMERLQAL